jgi:hypothetical protein
MESVYEPNAESVAAILENIEAVLVRAHSFRHGGNLFRWMDRRNEIRALFSGDFCAYYRFLLWHGAEAGRSANTRLIFAKINQVLVAALATSSKREFGRLATVLLYVLAGTQLSTSLPLLRQGALLYFLEKQPERASLMRRVAIYTDVGCNAFFRMANALP